MTHSSEHRQHSSAMEVYETDDAYVVLDGEHGLWCSRHDGQLTAKRGTDLTTAENPVCLGHVYGVIGKIAIDSDCQKLLLICRRTLIGRMPGGHDVFAINRIAALPLRTTETPDLGLEPCEKHHLGGMKKTEKPNPTTAEGQQGRPQPRALPLKKTWNSIKTATSHVKQRKPKDFNKDRDKFERRVTDELVKMFADTESFYYSHSADLTNSVQRQWKQRSKENDERRPLWRRVDDRFFWNHHMLRELIDLDDSEADHWIVPVIQGFVQMKSCAWNPDEGNEERDISRQTGESNGRTKTSRPLSIILISRRSRYRAGTRYRRRGVDESGKVANYVETEQIVEYEHHKLSFVQVRGSVPIYWSQIGYKYRPPPRLDKGEQETQTAFEKHFAEELDIYGSQSIVNLVEQAGKEKVIADAYLNHILKFDDPKLAYISFDFHEYCRGMRFENVSFLIVSIQDVIRDMLYCWTDREGIIYEQKGTFRVNCIDCLDRTNVVQTSLAKAVLEIQLTKLGVVPPEGLLPYAVRNALQVMWANNGDSLSRQYAGTAALKGDYTRTGERRFAGMVKDGYNSANRYYLNRFKDAYRQAAIDLMLGKTVSEEDLRLSTEADDDEEQDHAFILSQSEHVKQLIEDCKKLLVPETEIVIGGWALIDADPGSGDPSQQDADSILILTRDSYYVVSYDDEADRITSYQRVLLEDVEKIELGPEPSFFKCKYNCMRINYVLRGGQSGYFHMFRSTNVRFFNNMAIVIKSDEEALESLKAICDACLVALEVLSISVPFTEGKLERKKSKTLTAQTLMSNPFEGIYLDMPSMASIPRNVSEGQLLALKTAGTKAINNMTSQIARLNPMALRKSSSSFKKPSSKDVSIDALKRPSTARPQFHVASSSESEDEDHRIEHKNDALLDSCGILAFGGGIRPAASRRTDDLERTLQVANHTEKPPEIHISTEEIIAETACTESPNPFKKISHSLGSIEKVNIKTEDENYETTTMTTSLQPDVDVSMKTSHSEGAIHTSGVPVDNPTTTTTKDQLLSPLSKLAKGVQSFGMNLHRAANRNQRPATAVDTEASRQLRDRCLKSRTRIVQL